ncbi:MAG: hypothetical protein IJ576_07605, partial [Synergistaceae bacterium]|nr:hypothetical protein [Synergistaceae bacterium]MBR1418811.1 hypothetical protein [Synergistaceae bacterium]
MKRKFFSVFAFLALLLCCVQCAFADVAINAANFPDALFRLVVAYLDVNSDGQLSNAEIANCTTLNLSGGGITTLEGIEYLTSLTYLSCYSNDLTELDVSKNTKLTELNCALNENLTSLKIGGNTNLVTLECWGDKISELDLSGCSSLKSLRAFTNGLKTLKLNGCTSLEEADLPNNQLTEFDASPFSKLK